VMYNTRADRRSVPLTIDASDTPRGETLDMLTGDMLTAGTSDTPIGETLDTPTALTTPS